MTNTVTTATLTVALSSTRTLHENGFCDELLSVHGCGNNADGSKVTTGQPPGREGRLLELRATVNYVCIMFLVLVQVQHSAAPRQQPRYVATVKATLLVLVGIEQMWCSAKQGLRFNLYCSCLCMHEILHQNHFKRSLQGSLINDLKMPL